MLFHAPAAPARGSLLFLHAFGEEMNKSRRMAALASRALAAAGFAVLQIDLLGCGDSSGEIDEAGWSDWIDDAVLGAQWLQQRCSGPLWLWGQRAGCLLAAAAAPRLPQVHHFLFWQPQVSGKLTLQQFLRLKMASQMQQGASKGVTESLHADLAQGPPPGATGQRSVLALPASAGGVRISGRVGARIIGTRNMQEEPWTHSRSSRNPRRKGGRTSAPWNRTPFPPRPNWSRTLAFGPQVKGGARPSAEVLQAFKAKLGGKFPRLTVEV